MKYAEYLKQNGAVDADIAILDTPIAQRAFDTMQAKLAEESRLRAIAETDRTNFQNWYENEALPAYTGMQNQVVNSTAELARAKAAVIAAQDQGLSEIAKNLGWTKDGATPPASTPPASSMDTSKFVTNDTLTGFMDQAGDGLAALQDMVSEHASLFPGQRLNVTALRKEAVAAKKNIVQFWNEKYNVPTVRQAAADKDKAAYEQKLRDEGASAERAKYADQSNPNLRTLVPSHSPFTPRPDRADGNKQPWDLPNRSNDRVRRATLKVLEQSN